MMNHVKGIRGGPLKLKLMYQPGKNDYIKVLPRMKSHQASVTHKLHQENRKTWSTCLIWRTMQILKWFLGYSWMNASHNHDRDLAVDTTQRAKIVQHRWYMMRSWSSLGRERKQKGSMIGWIMIGTKCKKRKGMKRISHDKHRGSHMIIYT